MQKEELKLRTTLLRDLKRLIRFNTVSSKGNALFAAEIVRMLKLRGFFVSFQKYKINGQNYVNVFGSKGKGSAPLLLAAHTDTVPPGDLNKWTRTNQNPWKAVYFNGDIYGLGSADDKGSLLAMIHAGGAIAKSRLNRPFVIAATFGEEDGMAGAKKLIEHWKGPKPFGIVVGEPTNLEAVYKHKGLGILVIEIETLTGTHKASLQNSIRHIFKGKSAHSSRPWLGQNAIEKAVERLRGEQNLSPKLVITSLQGGTAANIIPSHAELSLLKKSDCSRLRPGLVPVFPAESILCPFDQVQNIIDSYKGAKDAAFKPNTITSSLGTAFIRNKTLRLTFDFRLLPGQDMTKIAAEIKRGLEQSLSKNPDIRFRMSLEHKNPPLGLKPQDPWALAIKRILKTNKLSQLLTAKAACTEAGLYSSWGVPSVVLGPGMADSNIHAPNESIELDQLERAVQLYRSIIEHACVNK